jgi:serine-type D-Ala-D-Ala carboxypeptidase/endopeptidase
MHVRLRPIVICCTLVGLAAPLVTAGPKIADDVKQNIRNRVDFGYTPGIAVGVVDATGSTFFQYGLTSKEGPPVDEKTLFEIGSITKVFTCTLLADLVEKGKLALDDPAEKYVHDGVKVPSRAGAKITLRHLANHTSALPRVPDNGEMIDISNPYAKYTSDLLHAFLADCELDYDIGTQYAYSNLGMGFLGHLLENVSGERYEKMIRKIITKPLGMKDTVIKLRGSQKKRMAKGHSKGKVVQAWDFDSLAGCGALRSTTTDMLRFLSANMGLKKTSLASTFALTQSERTATGVPNLAISLGWHVSNRSGKEYIWHSGGTNGFRSFCGFSPATKTGVVILTNSDHDVDKIAMRILDPTYALDEVKSSTSVPADTLEEYVGFYELRPNTIFTIRRDGQAMFATLTGQPEFAIFAESPTRFFYKAIDAQIEFIKDAAGKVDKLVLYQNGMVLPAKKLGSDYQPPPERVAIEIDPKILTAYVGQYALAPNVKFDVRADNGKLMVKITGQPRLEVYPESKTKFFYKVVDAQITFVKDDTGKVTSLILHQFGIDQTAPKIK